MTLLLVHQLSFLGPLLVGANQIPLALKEKHAFVQLKYHFSHQKYSLDIVNVVNDSYSWKLMIIHGISA